ncbi:MAG: division/cell wall cluster transcriptional repressor MraZ [Hyphomonadaceae bacterium]
MFVSTYESAIDAKGRVSVPAPFRAALGGSSRIYIYPAIDGTPCLEGGGETLMTIYKQTLARMSPQDPARKAFMHSFFTRTADLKMDDTGRIKLPEELLKLADIKGRVKFAGAFDRFHIWNPEQYAIYDAKMAAEAATHQDKMDAPFQAALAAGGIPGLAANDGEEG